MVHIPKILDMQALSRNLNILNKQSEDMKKILVSALVALCGFTASYAQEASFLSNNHCLYRINAENQGKKYLLLPVQEDAEMAHVKVIANNKQVKAFNVKLAKDHVDYLVPLDLLEFAGEKGLALDIQIGRAHV